jgi:predicted aspartyl protease
MGHAAAKVRLYNPKDPSRHLGLELLVDTGSTYTRVKRRRLEELGLKPMTRWKFRTIKGRVVEREIGEAVVECLGERAAVDCRVTTAVRREPAKRPMARRTANAGPRVDAKSLKALSRPPGL